MADTILSAVGVTVDPIARDCGFCDTCEGPTYEGVCLVDSSHQIKIACEGREYAVENGTKIVTAVSVTSDLVVTEDRDGARSVTPRCIFDSLLAQGLVRAVWS